MNANFSPITRFARILTLAGVVAGLAVSVIAAEPAKKDDPADGAALLKSFITQARADHAKIAKTGTSAQQTAAVQKHEKFVGEKLGEISGKQVKFEFKIEDVYSDGGLKVSPKFTIPKATGVYSDIKLIGTIPGEVTKLSRDDTAKIKKGDSVMLLGSAVGTYHVAAKEQLSLATIETGIRFGNIAKVLLDSPSITLK